MSLISSDRTDDFNRMNGERQTRNKPASQWLDDVVRQAQSDHDDAVAVIEGEKATIEHKHDNFLDSLETALERQDAAKAIDRKRQVHDLLTNANKLLEIYKAADDGVVAAFGGQSSLEDLQRKHEADAQRVKGVLQVGKRICAGELETVEQRGRAKEGIERDEVLEQAAGTFGAPQKGGNEDVERTLGCVERGVKRMLKGTE